MYTRMIKGAAFVALFFLTMIDGMGTKQREGILVDALSQSREFYLGQDISGIFPDFKEGKINVFVYWASWCSDCRDDIGNIGVWMNDKVQLSMEVSLINATDGRRETKESAKDYLSQVLPGEETLFDDGMKIGEFLGIQALPTVIVTDKQGRISSCALGYIPKTSELLLMAQEAETGKTKKVEAFIRQNMIRSQGGMRTNIGAGDGTLPSGEDVLCESQGMLMEYALSAGDRELFDLAFNEVSKRYNTVGLLPWVFEDGKDIGTNALIDDLRVASALFMAEEKWGRAYKELEKHSLAIVKYNTAQEGHPVDFYDTTYMEKAPGFTLCFGDLDAMRQLAVKQPDFAKAGKEAERIIQNGMISEKFPFYYPLYHYESQSYQGNSLHMSEALTCILHLAEIGQMQDATLYWLEKEIKSGPIYARYRMDGTPDPEGRFESTSVYALGTLIAVRAGNKELAGLFLKRMEAFRIRDDKNDLCGAFSADGMNVYSYDQLTALLAYVNWEKMICENG